MKRKFLEDLGLEKEVVDKILDENSADIGKAKGEFDSVKSERDKLKTDLSERDKQLEDLKKSTGDAEALTKQIEQLQAENKKKDEVHAAEIRKIQRESIDAELLTTAKAKNIKAVLGLLDAVDDTLDIDAYKAKRNEQIETLIKAEDTKFLFDAETKKTKIKGAAPGETGKEDPDAKVDVSKMSYEELAAYIEANPDAEI
ncbi:hypothetical protein FHR92_003965 [Fontibacillus solani]|uniref:Scaffolding protein n=1 Tax=Fontibacillus solani TaxID=1572857 RepID=A0A7W3SWE3_9BACL|nr:phage scaffolding protein [Fontibacillus solani]MBA9087480.1 hypothetical protein [Fontibacillus solani]